MSNKPVNIVLLTIDCWRADYLGANGSAPSPTPNLDRLAAQSLVFDQAITCGGWTRPSITALLSSTHPAMFGGPLGSYASERPSLPETLQSNGYETAGFSTNPQVGRSFGFDRGFNFFSDSEPDGTYSGSPLSRVKGGQRLLQQPVTHRLFGPLGIHTLPPEVTAPAEQVNDQIAAWLDRHRTRPAFVWAHYMDAHWPYHILRRKYMPQEFAFIWRDLNVMSKVAAQHGKLDPGKDQIIRLKRLYRQALEYVDASIGKLISRLQAMGIWEKTVLIVTSDHGEEFYEHGCWGHFQLYDETIRAPLVLRLPGASSQGQNISKQVSLLDVAPTILDAAGIPKPGAMLGSSLLDLAHNNAGATGEAFTLSVWPKSHRLAIRTENYKYLFNSKQPDDSRLFDILEDPRESRNIIHQALPVARRFKEMQHAYEELARATHSAPASSPVIDAAMADRLKALGYLD